MLGNQVGRSAARLSDVVEMAALLEALQQRLAGCRQPDAKSAAGGGNRNGAQFSSISSRADPPRLDCGISGGSSLEDGGNDGDDIGSDIGGDIGGDVSAAVGI